MQSDLSHKRGEGMDIMTAVLSVVEEMECGIEYMFIPDPKEGGFIVVKGEQEE